MKKNASIYQLIKLWGFISEKRRVQYKLLLILMGFSSVFEMLGIGATVPFIAVLSNPEVVYNSNWSKIFIKFLSINSPNELILPITILFLCITLCAVALKFITGLMSIRVANRTVSDLSLQMYELILHQPYSYHLLRNSSQQINLITQKANILSSVLMISVSIISGLLSLFGIIIALLFINFWISFSLFVIFGCIYSYSLRITKNKLLLNSQIISLETTQVVKALQEGLGGIRHIIIDNKQSIYTDKYRNADIPMRIAHGNSSIIASYPKYIIEFLSIVSLVLITYWLSKGDNGLIEAIPILGAFAMGAQRLMPISQGIYTGWSSIRSNYASCEESIELLNLANPKKATSISKKKNDYKWDFLKLKSVNFRYTHDSPLVLKDINIEIQRGSYIGIIGTSGCGKSTLLDIIIGLFQPTDGHIEIDGRVLRNEELLLWQSQIAHIPQNIFLSDSTVMENIAFGVPKSQIDLERVKAASSMAQLDSTISSWKDGLLTQVGERGILLSGGQRQRIGIARALYKDAKLLIFDEATNSLDFNTESDVVDTINKLCKDFTMIIVAHRISTLSNCSKIIEISNGEIKRQGTFEQLCK
jgi:ABC-type multidrug transport system fused ATPase/permease subunit